MRRIVWVVAIARLRGALRRLPPTQQAPGGPHRRQAVGVSGANREESFPQDPAPKMLPGSTQEYTQEQIDDLLNPPDWYPDQHPTPPAIVVKGHGGAMACGACHLMSGLGHPESSDLTGLTAPYIVQQMIDFKSGARKDPTGKRMNGIAMEATDKEVREAAEYFAALPRKPFQKVTEAAMVPKTFLGNGRMRFVDPGGGMEPIGHAHHHGARGSGRGSRLRDPNSGFVIYVPPGSLARGKTIVETGGGKTIACGICHGAGSEGVEHDAPPGRHAPDLHGAPAVTGSRMGRGTA